jgi:hypothetical protein
MIWQQTDRNLGRADVLAKYHSTRHPDISLRVKGSACSTRLASQPFLLRDLRIARGIRHYSLLPLRETLMKLDMAPGALFPKWHPRQPVWGKPDYLFGAWNQSV